MILEEDRGSVEVVVCINSTETDIRREFEYVLLSVDVTATATGRNKFGV